MSDRIKKQAKVKEPIRIRYKPLKDGNRSIYLDLYYEGKREYEFLKLYLVPETSVANREANLETLKLANAIKAKKIVEMQNTAYGFSIGGMRGKASLVEYIERIADKKREQTGERRGSYQFYMALAYHIRRYSGDKTVFRHVDREYCMGFIEYMKTAKNKLNDRPLDENTQRQYIKRLSSVLYTAITDGIITSNPFLHIRPEELPKTRSRDVNYLTIDEVRKLIDTPCYYADIRNAFLFSCNTDVALIQNVLTVN